MTKPLPTEIPPPSISHLAQQREDCLRHKYHGLERILAQALRENRVRAECLEIAIKALQSYVDIGSTRGLYVFAQQELAEIEARLAQLEPEEETG